MGLKRNEKIKLNSTNIYDVRKLALDIDKKLTKEISKRAIEKARIFIGFGIAIIAFDIIKDSLYEMNTWHYKIGFGWQQWVLIGLGFVLIGRGLILLSEKK